MRLAEMKVGSTYKIDNFICKCLEISNYFKCEILEGSEKGKLLLGESDFFNLEIEEIK